MNEKISLVKLILVLSLALILRMFEVISPTPAYARFSYEKGLSLKGEKDLNRAIKEFKKAIFHDKQYKYAYYQVGKIYGEIGEVEKEIEYFNSAVTLGFSDDAEVFCKLGIYYVNEGSYELAIGMFDRTLEVIHVYKNESEKHLYAKANHFLAEIYKERKEYRKAKICFEKAITFDKRYVRLYFEIGEIDKMLGEEGDFKSKISTLRRTGYSALADELDDKFFSKTQ